MASDFVEWTTKYPAEQDPDDNSEQPDLINDPTSAPRPDGTGNSTRVSQVHALRDKLQEVAKKVGDDSDLPAGSLSERVTDLESEPPAHASSHESTGDDTITHDNLSGAGTYSHSQIDSHIGSASNPHTVTKSQVGLSNVTDDSQLKRAAGDIGSFDEKLVVASGDYVLIEDSANSWNKKKAKAGNFPFATGGGGTGTDEDAIHDNVANEINALTGKSPVTSGDYVIVEDSEDSWNKKKVKLGDIAALTLPGQTTDNSAVHVDTANEFSVLELVVPVSGDHLILEDASDSWNKKRVKAGDIASLAGFSSGGGGTDDNAIHTTVAGEIYALDNKATPVDADVVVIEDSADLWNKKKIGLTSLLDKTDSLAVHTSTANEINTISEKTAVASGDYVIIEDSGDSWNKKKAKAGNIASLAGGGGGSSTYTTDTKSPQGTWATTTTINFAARPGQPATSRLTFQDNEQRTSSGTLAWAVANGVADLGYDEAASQGNTKWLYFYAVPKSGDDSLFTVRASDNDPATGPTGYTNWRYIGTARIDASGDVIEFTQIGGSRFRYREAQEVFDSTTLPTTWTAIDLSAAIPATSRIAQIQTNLKYSNSLLPGNVSTSFRRTGDSSASRRVAHGVRIGTKDAHVFAYAHGMSGVQANGYREGVYDPINSRIYFAPLAQANQTNWHYIDCTTGAVVAYAHGVTAVANAYIGSVYDPINSRVYFVPYAQANQTNWHYINCATGAVVAYAHGATAVANGYTEGVYDPINSRVYFVPYAQANQTNWHYVDCATGNVVAYAHGATAMASAYSGCLYEAINNRIYFVPYAQSNQTNWHYIDATALEASSAVEVETNASRSIDHIWTHDIKRVALSCSYDITDFIDEYLSYE